MLRRPKAGGQNMQEVALHVLGIVVLLYATRAVRRASLLAVYQRDLDCPPPLPVAAVEQAGRSLEEAGSSEKDKGPPPPFFLYRFIGNNMVPLQCYGQLYRNTRYTLDHEEELRDCRKLWVLNNIVNRTERGMLLDLLLTRGFTTDDVIVRRLNYSMIAQLPEDERVPTVTAQNEARNFMIRHGVSKGARWILAFDGNQFYTSEAWEAIRAAGLRWEAEGYKYFKVPMYRVYSEQTPAWLNASTTFNTVREYAPVLWESQFAVRNDSDALYRERTMYGKDNKLEMLDRVCGTGRFYEKRPLAEHPADTGLCGCHVEVGNDRRTRKIVEDVALLCGYSVRLWYFPCEGVNASAIFTDTKYRADLRTEGHDRLTADILHEIRLVTQR